MWGTEDPEPGHLETNFGWVTLSVTRSWVSNWSCDFSKTQHLDVTGSLRAAVRMKLGLVSVPSRQQALPEVQLLRL